MPPLTSKQFRAKLATDPLTEIVQRHVIEGEPYVFQSEPDDYALLRLDLSESLAIPESSFAIVGSAKVGFSLSPTRFGRPFNDESDVDLVVVDPGRFDRLWYALVDWDYQLGKLEGWRLQWRRKRRDDVYWGWFLDEPLKRMDQMTLPSALRVVRDISNEWFEAFQSIGLRHAKLAGRKFSGRLYRTWQHVISYHADSLRQIRPIVASTDGETK